MMSYIRAFSDKYEVTSGSVVGVFSALLVSYWYFGLYNSILEHPLWLQFIGVLFIISFTMLGFIFSHWLIYQLKPDKV